MVLTTVSDAEKTFVMTEKAMNIASVVEDIVLENNDNSMDDEGIYIQIGNYSFERNWMDCLFPIQYDAGDTQSNK